MRFILYASVALAVPLIGLAQPFVALNAEEKLTFHARNSFGPLALAGIAAYAGILQEADAPMEWGQGARGYGKRFASTLAYSGIHGALALGLDTTLHQDPRYFRSTQTGFWSRTGHAFRGTILTHTDDGAERLSTWRIGSAYGAAFISNQWYPGRLNTVGLGFAEGSIQLGFDLLGNIGSEFWPDIKRKVFRRK
jgi:hypothetical protein